MQSPRTNSSLWILSIYLSKLGVFFRSSRQDPNPLVLADSATLRVPVLAFSSTTVRDWLGRITTLCHGLSNAAGAQRVLKAMDPAEMQLPEFRSLGDDLASQFDFATKRAAFKMFIASIRGDDGATGTTPREVTA